MGGDVPVEEPAEMTPQWLETGRLCYSILPDQPIRGMTLRTGQLWYLSAEDHIEPVEFNLFVNGFRFAAGAQETAVALNPFALVRNCKFQSNYPSLNLADFKIFKVSLFVQSACFYFGVRGSDERHAEEERSRWVLDISRTIRLVTQSLFPRCSIFTNPLPTLACTQHRLLAGYMLRYDNKLVASLLFCELHAQQKDAAKLSFYENETCKVHVMDLYITERSICCEKLGINCSCFSIEDQQFTTLTLAERKVWLRAISNVKVKLQNQAPSPSPKELQSYRDAIKESLDSIKVYMAGRSNPDPLLRTVQLRDPPSLGMKEVKDHHMVATPATPGDVGGTNSPVQATCDDGHVAWVQPGDPVTPPICRPAKLGVASPSAGWGGRGCRYADASGSQVLAASGTGGTFSMKRSQEIPQPGDG